MQETICISLISDRDGGLEESFVFYGNLLAELGYKVCVLAPADAPYLKRLSKQISHVNFRPTGYYDVLALIKLAHLIAKYNPVKLIGFNSRATHYFSIIGKLIRSKLVIGYSHSYKYKKMLKADAVICVTNDMREFFIVKGFDPERIFVLPPVGVEISVTPTRGGKLGKSELKIGFLGRISPEKGLLTLIEAVRLTGLKNKFRLKIAGNGPDRTVAEALSRKYGLDTEFLGWLEEKAQFFSEIDILALPSSSETFGISIIEALSHGVPVLATPTSGAKSILHEEKCGWLSEDTSAESFAKKLKELSNKNLDIYKPECLQTAKQYSTDEIRSALHRVLTEISP